MSDFGKGTKIKALDEKADGNFVRHAMTGIRNAIMQKRFSGLIGKDLISDGLLGFRGLEALAASYQNNIRLSPSKPLLTANPEIALEEIYKDFVSGKDQESKGDKPITRDVMRKEIHKVFNSFGLLDFGVKEKVKLPVPSKPIDFAYKNEVMHYYQTISFNRPDGAFDVANAYRTVARDIHNQEKLDIIYSKAKFAIIGYFPKEPTTDKDVKILLDLISGEGIELHRYGSINSLAKEIKQSLSEHNNLLA